MTIMNIKRKPSLKIFFGTVPVLGLIASVIFLFRELLEFENKWLPISWILLLAFVIVSLLNRLRTSSKILNFMEMAIYVCYNVTFLINLIFWVQRNDQKSDIFWLSLIFFIYVNLNLLISKISDRIQNKTIQTIWTLFPIVLLLIFMFIYFIFKIVENWSKIL